MKWKTYNRWVGRRVRLKLDSQRRVGTVVAPGAYRTWWQVQWPDGSRKLYPERELVIEEPS